MIHQGDDRDPCDTVDHVDGKFDWKPKKGCIHADRMRENNQILVSLDQGPLRDSYFYHVTIGRENVETDESEDDGEYLFAESEDWKKGGLEIHGEPPVVGSIC